ncbi:hypothetical protein [Agromyces sp. NPDC057865]|uniref:hypothetical protein n=1 Tax=Agromyces sp. NPDC057865 TaxID=3346267 RepID=UPI00367214F3
MAHPITLAVGPAWPKAVLKAYEVQQAAIDRHTRAIIRTAEADRAYNDALDHDKQALLDAAANDPEGTGTPPKPTAPDALFALNYAREVERQAEAAVADAGDEFHAVLTKHADEIVDPVLKFVRTACEDYDRTCAEAKRMIEEAGLALGQANLGLRNLGLVLPHAGINPSYVPDIQLRPQLSNTVTNFHGVAHRIEKWVEGTTRGKGNPDAAA